MIEITNWTKIKSGDEIWERIRQARTFSIFLLSCSWLHLVKGERIAMISNSII